MRLGAQATFYDAGVSPLGSSRSLANLEETSIALVAPARPTATLGPAAQLFLADYRQDRPQVFVVSDRALVDLANLVEGPV
ncbi:MAG TPA: hypothetical protein VGI28_08870, partial [Stellaceae bacterium]